MIRRLRAFGAFWYGFVVGDDWRVAAGVVVALGLTATITRITAVPAWWIVVVAVGVLLASSIRGAIRRSDQPAAPR
ncbi:hypothetical protein CIW49_05685 [Mycolicibacterium sp. P1-18]|uniref:hypothetical protein n=1 Tax=Mycolicibacterium sp. P1-18 TaxID=2024615 RepID=UPI0011F207F8|nr:hypothetical protein [Mycolicibacterium sp. P1-18]KAA0101008.1 hypothetical protein CIW49_05685 [Mycolicibacterium sp. P1-18]